MLRAECKSQADAWLCIFKQKEEIVNASWCLKTSSIVAQFGRMKMKVARLTRAVQAKPPLARTIWELTHPPSSLTKNDTTRAMSSGCPSRSSGVALLS